MVLGKKVVIFDVLGNGAKIRPLDKGKKCPVTVDLTPTLNKLVKLSVCVLFYCHE